MDARELRIGNYFDDTEIGVCQVEQICTYSSKSDNLGVTYRNRSCWCELDSINPIPLTPEWLERMGFKKQSNGKDYTISAGGGSFYYTSWNDKAKEIHALSVCHPMIDSSSTAFAWHIKTVHQLQNLYFSLTGSELTIK